MGVKVHDVAGGVPVAGRYSGTDYLQRIETECDPVRFASGVASAQGNNTCLTPAAGKKLRIRYLSYNPEAAVEAGFRLGAAGTLFLRNKLAVGGSVIAKDLGAIACIDGAADEPLVLNLSAAVATIWNVFYTEV